MADASIALQPKAYTKTQTRLESDTQIAVSNLYFKPLDALRALSVYFVFAEHMVNVSIWGRFSPGRFGVDFFFVLSGFLITGILLDQKTKYQQKKTSISRIIKSFYTRRLLRIFPLYYALVVLLLIGNYQNIRDYAIYYIGYLVNYIYIFSEVKGQAPAAHLWSLSVEEQFYLVWPFIILYFSLKTIRYITFIAFIIIPVILSLYFNSVEFQLFINSPLGYFNSLGIGSFLAIFIRTNKTINWKSCLIVFVISLLTYVLSVVLINNLQVVSLIKNYLQPLLHGSMILFCISYSNKYLDKIWNNRFLSYSGKISYGLYVYHGIIIYLFNVGFEKMGMPFHQFAGRLQVPILVAATYLVAMLSWEFFEKKILSYKSKFSY